MLVSVLFDLKTFSLRVSSAVGFEKLFYFSSVVFIFFSLNVRTLPIHFKMNIKNCFTFVKNNFIFCCYIQKISF
jgi:uncharacterized membrane protein